EIAANHVRCAAVEPGRLRIALRHRAPHTGMLCALTGKDEESAHSDHSRMQEAQLRPAPKPHIASVLPRWSLPSASASHSAMGIDAADVLPYLWTLVNTFSGGSS